MSKPIYYKSKNLDLSSIGEVELKFVSYGDVQTHQSFDSEDISERTLAQKVIFHQLVEPKFNFEYFTDHITDSDLEELINAYVELDEGSFNDFSPSTNLIDEFAKAIKISLQERRKRDQEFIEPFRKSAQESFSKIQEAFGRIQDSLPNLKDLDDKSIVSEPIQFVSPEQNAWERHSESMEAMEKSVLLQEQILSEQKSSSSNAKAALFVARFTLAVAAATLVATFF